MTQNPAFQIPAGNVLVYYLNNGVYDSFSVAGNGRLGHDLSNLNFPNGIYQDSLYNFYIADNLYDSLYNNYGRIVKWPLSASSGELIAGGKGMETLQTRSLLQQESPLTSLETCM